MTNEQEKKRKKETVFMITYLASMDNTEIRYVYTLCNTVPCADQYILISFITAAYPSLKKKNEV